jgi:TolB-like protein
MKKSALAAAIFLLNGCVSGPGYQTGAGSALVRVNYEAADQLARSMAARRQLGPVIVLTFSNIDDLEKTSRLGRTLAEQIGSRLSQAGIHILEIRLRDSVYISKDNQGEFMLSREVKDISAMHKVNTVVVGTYAEAGNSVYVTAKAVDLPSGSILASHDYALPNVDEIKAMLPRAVR